MKVHFMPERSPPSFRRVIDAEQGAGHTVLVVLPRRLENRQPLSPHLIERLARLG